MRRFLDAEDSDDPIQSVVNIIDVFLVMMAVLLVMVVQSDVGSLGTSSSADRDGDVAIDAEVETLTEYEASGEIGEGQGVRAGTTYRLEDGSLIFVPD